MELASFPGILGPWESRDSDLIEAHLLTAGACLQFLDSEAKADRSL